MESKTKHRILGIVVVAGLAVVAYPFLVGNSSTPKAEARIKAPPFPDQAIQVSSSESDDTITIPSDTLTVSAAQTPPPEVQMPVSPTPPEQKSSMTPDTQQATVNTAQESTPDQTVPAASASAPAPVASASGTNTAPAAAATESTSPANAVQQPATPKVKSAAKKTIKKTLAAKKMVIHSRLASKSSSAYKNETLDRNGLIQLKQAAWVVQLGSFKHKTNALKLVNKLRANGYRAFIQEINVSSGDNTRVFVGPEHKQTAARQLASDLEKELKLHGIVISYKPFTL